MHAAGNTFTNVLAGAVLGEPPCVCWFLDADLDDSLSECGITVTAELKQQFHTMFLFPCKSLKQVTSYLLEHSNSISKTSRMCS